MNGYKDIELALNSLTTEVEKSQHQQYVQNLSQEQKKNREIDSLNMKEFFSEMGTNKQMFDDYMAWIAEQKAKGKAPQEISSVQYYKQLKGTLFF